MLNCINKLSSIFTTKPDMVVHIGAGSGQEVEAYFRLGCEKIHLIEANRNLAGQIEDRYRGNAAVSVENLAITAGTETLPFNIFNVEYESSLLDAEGLLQYYPQLNVLERTSVANEPFVSLLSRLTRNSTDGNNLLVIETTGYEATLFAALPEPEPLHAFKWIAVRAGHEQPIYRSASTAQETRAILDRLGYTETMSCGGEYPYIEELLFQRDEVKVERAHLIAKLAKLELTLAAQSEALEARHRELAALNDEVVSLRSELQHNLRELETIRQESEQTTQQLGAQKRWAEHLSKELDKVVKLNDELAAGIAPLHAACEASEKQAAEKERIAGELSLKLSVLEQRERRFDSAMAKTEAQLRLLEEALASHRT